MRNEEPLLRVFAHRARARYEPGLWAERSADARLRRARQLDRDERPARERKHALLRLARELARDVDASRRHDDVLRSGRERDREDRRPDVRSDGEGAMITFVVALVGAIIFWRLVAHGFRLGAQATAATERTSAILEAVLPPEKLELVRAVEARREEERAAADLAYRRKRAVAIWIVIGIVLLLVANGAKAQGIYMGRDGRVHAQVIVGDDGRAWPVVPSPSYAGPSPLYLAPPVPYAPPPGPPPVYGYGPPVYGYVVPPPVVYVDPAAAFFGALIGSALRPRYYRGW